MFRMNLTYYNLHSDQIPVWSSTLQTIELIQLRKWDTEAAEMFFDSLLESAGTLPDLRRLVIQAILNIGWRDRASFRDKWVGSLNRVFKRISEPPKVITSILPFPAHDAVTESPKIAEHKPSDIVAPVPRAPHSAQAWAAKLPPLPRPRPPTHQHQEQVHLHQPAALHALRRKIFSQASTQNPNPLIQTLHSSNLNHELRSAVLL